MSKVEEIKRLLAACTKEQRRKISEYLRQEFPIHPLEKKLNAQAELILEAIDRGSDLILRGVRGVIAEAAFKLHVVSNMKGWRDETPSGNHPFDFLLRDTQGQVTVQVKMQRLKDHRPMFASQGYKRLPADMYVVETQRTRGGRDPHSGSETRPYKFGEFDVLAVSMHPSTGDWHRFMYTVCRWLLPRPENAALILKFQPVAQAPNETWTADFNTCVQWYRSGRAARIWRESPE